MAEKPTQAQFAALVGIEQPTVSELIRKGVLTRNATITQWIREYCANLREQAAGRQSESATFDLVAERARLAARQSEKAEIDNARARAELVPRALVSEIMSFQNSTVRSRVLGIANALKAKHPELSTAIFLSLKEITSDVLKNLSHVRFPADLDERIKQIFRDLHTPAKPDGNGMG